MERGPTDSVAAGDSSHCCPWILRLPYCLQPYSCLLPLSECGASQRVEFCLVGHQVVMTQIVCPPAVGTTGLAPRRLPSPQATGFHQTTASSRDPGSSAARQSPAEPSREPGWLRSPWGWGSGFWHWDSTSKTCLWAPCPPCYFWAQGSQNSPPEKRCEGLLHEGGQRPLCVSNGRDPWLDAAIAFGACPITGVTPFGRYLTALTSIIFYQFLLLFPQIQNWLGPELMKFSWFQLSHQDSVWRVICDPYLGWADFNFVNIKIQSRLLISWKNLEKFSPMQEKQLQMSWMCETLIKAKFEIKKHLLQQPWNVYSI